MNADVLYNKIIANKSKIRVTTLVIFFLKISDIFNILLEFHYRLLHMAYTSWGN